MARMCDVCGVRPAVGTVSSVRPGQPPEVRYLCQIHLEEGRLGGSDPGSGFGGLGLFDDFFSRFFGQPSSGAGGAPGPDDAWSRST